MADLRHGGRPLPPERRIKFLLSDVDGTLVTKDKRLTSATIEAAGRLAAAGIMFATTSSRPPQGMRMLVQALGVTAPLAGFNGGMFVSPGMELLEQRPLPEQAARDALEIIGQSGADAWIFVGNDWMVINPDGAHVAHECGTIQYKPRIVSDYAGVDFTRVSKLVAVSDDMTIMANCELALQENIGSIATAARSQSYYIDVTNRDANKGAVLDWLSQKFAIPPEQFAAIGDMQNDVRMFRVAGLAIAMGNAKDDVQGEAHLVTSSNEEDGFARAVDALLENWV